LPPFMLIVLASTPSVEFDMVVVSPLMVIVVSEFNNINPVKREFRKISFLILRMCLKIQTEIRKNYQLITH
ncbi:MAG: hypothetical protein H6Q18_703, partial [Bacteroidetes bacterium]|nr:hypothetical protein [Bacteroidota bacterium]